MRRDLWSGRRLWMGRAQTGVGPEARGRLMTLAMAPQTVSSSSAAVRWQAGRLGSCALLVVSPLRAVGAALTVLTDRGSTGAVA